MYLSGAALSVKAISDYGSFGFADFWNNLKAGWPAGLWLKKNAALSLPRGYLEMIVETDISRLDGIERNPDKVLLLLRSLARNSATQAGETAHLPDWPG